MEYRSTFTKTKSDEKVSSLRTKDGAIFEDFELTLPKGSTISRIEPNVIKIETKKFHIIFTINYQGMYVLDHLFTGFYLGDLDYLDLKPCRMEIKIDVNFKVGALLSSRESEYYAWIDSFLNYVDKKFSFDRFVKEINWSTVASFIQVVLHNPLLFSVLALSQKGSTLDKSDKK